jgi:hypothetical protein
MQVPQRREGGIERQAGKHLAREKLLDMGLLYDPEQKGNLNSPFNRCGIAYPEVPERVPVKQEEAVSVGVP